jgi:glucosamine--fructose-6-phosphate aminotransferase (isomerizing)
MYLGSYALAPAPLTQQISYLKEDDWVVVRRSHAQFYDSKGAPVTCDICVSGASAAAVEKCN